MSSPEAAAQAAWEALLAEGAGELWTRLASIQERSACLFSLGENRFGLEGSSALEVLRPGLWTEVPGTAPAVLGLCQLRGRLHAVVDPLALLEPETAVGPLLQSDHLLSIEVNGVRAALRLAKVPRLVPWLEGEFTAFDPPRPGLLGELLPTEAAHEPHAVLDPVWLAERLRALKPSSRI